MARPLATKDQPSTVDRLLDAADAAFARAGFESARLEDIAAAAGIRRPSLLHHFPTKEELYTAVIQRAFSRLGAALGSGLSIGMGVPFAEQVDALVASYLAFLSQQPTFAPLVLREVIDGRGPGRDLLLREVVPLLDLVEALVQGGRSGARLGVPVRAAILQVACAPLVNAASGPLGPALWGTGPDATPALARALLLPAGAHPRTGTTTTPTKPKTQKKRK
jgi:AcrR family transcriptional regulator